MPYYPEKKPGNELPPLSEDSPRRGRKSRPYRLVMLLSLAAMLYGAVRLGIYGFQMFSQRHLEAELREVNRAETEAAPERVSAEPPSAESASLPRSGKTSLPAEEESASSAASQEPSAAKVTDRPAAADTRLSAVPYPENNPPIIRERFIRLRKKSEYIAGWLQAGNIIDQAVVQKDNSYFLNRDATGKKNPNGALFLDESISLRTRPYTLVIYGHNMKSGEMFGRLRKFQESPVFYGHRILTFDTIYEDGKYALFAAGELGLIPGVGNYVDFSALVSVDTGLRRQAIRQLEQASVCGSAIDVKPEDQLLLLLTCTSDDDHRTFLAARRLREGEDENAIEIRP